jgi:hypothetical protein
MTNDVRRKPSVFAPQDSIRIAASTYVHGR